MSEGSPQSGLCRVLSQPGTYDLGTVSLEAHHIKTNVENWFSLWRMPRPLGPCLGGGSPQVWGPCDTVVVNTGRKPRQGISVEMTLFPFNLVPGILSHAHSRWATGLSSEGRGQLLGEMRLLCSPDFLSWVPL